MLRVRIVVATLERPGRIERLIPQILEQAPHHATVVVVDQSGNDAQVQNATTLGRFKGRVEHVVHQPPGLPGARNRALRGATEDVVWFLDDDVELHPGCLAAHLAAYRNPKIGGVVGRIIEQTLVSNTWFTTNRVDWTGRIRTNLAGPDPCRVATLKGANMSFRRSALATVGGFDEGYRGTALLEDADVSSRVREHGFELRYEPDAIVIHHHDAAGGVRDSSVHEGRSKAYWRAHNTARYVRRHFGARALPALCVGQAATLVVRRMRGAPREAVPAVMRGIWMGWHSLGGQS